MDTLYLENNQIRGSRLRNRVSDTTPLQAGTFSHGVVTMCCDLTTCTSAHISILVSGSAQTCFDDQLLESHIKYELIEKSQLVHVLPSCEESKPSLPDPLSFAVVAYGASVFEVSMKVPTQASQYFQSGQIVCDGNWLYSVSEDGTVKLWDLRLFL